MSLLLGPIRQNGYVVRDIEATLRYWTGVLGVGPFFYMEKVTMDYFNYRGQPSPAAVSIALGNSGDLQIELIAQRNDAPSLYRDFLEAGYEGLQHVAFWTKTYQEDLDRMLARGFRIGHDGSIGGPQGRFAYFETDSHPGTVVELSDVSGTKGAFFDLIRQAAATWDGTDPIRRVG